jgi:hypothetical protein
MHLPVVGFAVSSHLAKPLADIFAFSPEVIILSIANALDKIPLSVLPAGSATEPGVR